jgi:tetratricopeptide (TPR) repeat protein
MNSAFRGFRAGTHNRCGDRLNFFIFLMAAGLAAMVWIAPCAAQPPPLDARSQLGFARQLFDQGHYRRAAEEYQRFVYLFPDDPHRRDCLLQAGRSFYEAGDMPAAITQLRELTQDETLDGPAEEAYFLTADCHLRLSEPGPALLTLHNLAQLTANESARDRAYFRIGWIRVDQLDWSGATEAFNRISDAGRESYKVDSLRETLAHTDQIPRKNPRLAGFLSILPGAGQLYSGRYEDALVAFLVNGGLILATFQAFDQDLPALGALLAFVEAGFYSGNIYGAVSSAHKYNRSRQRRFADELLRSWSVGVPPLSRGRLDEGVVVSLRLAF